VKRSGDSLAAFVAWCVIGAGFCLGVLSMLTIGPFVLLVTLFLCAFLLYRVEFGWAMGGLLTGAAAPLLYVAWLNRHGPGEVCTSTATSQSCGDEWSPWPFVAVAAALIVAGVVMFARNRR
jgi:hypothetical protein